MGVAAAPHPPPCIAIAIVETPCLQVAFFDIDESYTITPLEMLEGLQRLNCLGLDAWSCKMMAAKVRHPCTAYLRLT